MNALVLAGVLLSACGGDAEIAGHYVVDLTASAEDDCGLFNAGDVTSDLELVIAHDTNNVTVHVEGDAAAGLVSLVGSAELYGTFDGGDLVADAAGVIAHQRGNCTVYYSDHLTGSVDGDAIGGTLEYRGSGCACRTVQTYYGKRTAP